MANLMAEDKLMYMYNDMNAILYETDASKQQMLASQVVIIQIF